MYYLEIPSLFLVTLLIITFSLVSFPYEIFKHYVLYNNLDMRHRITNLLVSSFYSTVFFIVSMGLYYVSTHGKLFEFNYSKNLIYTTGLFFHYVSTLYFFYLLYISRYSRQEVKYSSKINISVLFIYIGQFVFFFFSK